MTLQYATVDDPNIFVLIDEIYELNMGNYVRSFNTSEEIINHLKTQWAYLFKESLITFKNSQLSSRNSKINSYKMFYYRHQRKMSFKALSSKTKINSQKLDRLERLKKNRELDDPDIFQNCSIEDISKIEKALDCPKDLKTGKENGFGTEYINYYKLYKLESLSSKFHSSGERSLFKHRAIVFDFDGTLTLRDNSNSGKTTWQTIWELLGYENSLCSKYFLQYIEKEISHQKWCDITAEYFIKKNFGLSHLKEIAKNIYLVPGVEETLKYFQSCGVKMYIASGSIKQVIDIVLGDNIAYFNDVRANNMIFNDQQNLVKIIGTSFDFEGKATYIEKIASENGFTTSEVMYIGNSINDVSAYKSGADTLCVNPHFTDPTNKRQWKDSIINMTNFKDIIDYVNI
ncbi:hypothetical protein GEO60473_21990 [Geobacter sp. 60473]|nr:hypothetical protein GEO60473_21990 [Geobacter sp. 60473]